MSEEGSGRPAAPDPQEWGVWHETKRLAAAAKNRLIEEASIRRTMAPEERIFKLQEAVTKGNGARRLLENDFWIDDIEPFLKSESFIRPWDPKADGWLGFMRLVTQYVFGSGQARIVVKLIDRIHRLDKEGAEAEKILISEAEKRKRAESARG